MLPCLYLVMITNGDAESLHSRKYSLDGLSAKSSPTVITLRSQSLLVIWSILSAARHCNQGLKAPRKMTGAIEFVILFIFMIKPTSKTASPFLIFDSILPSCGSHDGLLPGSYGL